MKILRGGFLYINLEDRWKTGDLVRENDRICMVSYIEDTGYTLIDLKSGYSKMTITETVEELKEAHSGYIRIHAEINQI